MGPETIAVAATKAAIEALITSIFTELVAGSGKTAAAPVKSVLKRWRTDRTLQKVYERSKQIRKVKTIWQVEREIDLLKFYYPSKIKSSSEPPKEVGRLRDFSFDGNLVVRGIVGQGKSTFLRYLAACELQLGERLPVFIELRRLAPNQAVVDAVIEEMKNLGLDDATAEIVEYLANSSRLALLLDGFDELSDERASTLVQELESLALRMPNLRMIVTSRPENAIERSPHFRVYDLAPLAPGEYAKVVARITRNQTLAEEIVCGVDKSHQGIARLLTTPLMVSLLVVHYRVGQGIPENRIAFYEPLFMLLLLRHDSAKAGYRRKRSSDLSDSQLLSFFNCLCFITRRDGVTVLRGSSLNSAAARALKWVNIAGTTPDDALDDILRITCLILKDGSDEYRFLHKSVQEFHAASFVCGQPDSLAGEFYGAMHRRWSDWEQELLFLKVIHQDCYDRFFEIPMLDQVVSTLVGASPSELGKELIGRLVMRVTLRPRVEFLNVVYPRDPVGWCLMNYFDGSALFEGITDTSVRLARRASEQQSRLDQCDIPGRDVLAELAPAHHRALDAEAEALGKRVVNALEERKARMHTLDERKGLFDI
jgi:PII-like signaling protein